MTNLLDDVIARLNGLPDGRRDEVVRQAMDATRHLVWVPNPGPQTAAYNSEADELYFGGQAGGGKLLKLDTPIPTPTGWTTMGEVAVGDFVIDEDGNPCRVVAKSNVEYEDAFELVFSDGSRVTAGARHQWITRDLNERFRRWACTPERRSLRRENRPLRGTGKRPDLAARNSAEAKDKGLPLNTVRSTQSIVESLRKNGRINHSVDVARPMKLPEAELLIDPYVLGAWLGDGSKDSGQITGLDEEIFENVANSYQVTRHACPKSRGVIGLMKHLRQLGVSGNKHIPAAYLRASYDQRVAILQGLMDTDGHCDLRGQCEIQLTRKVLIDGVSELLSSLGVKVQMREGVAKIYGRIISPKWRLKFLTDIPAFRLGRKLLRQKRSGFRGTHDVRYIVDAAPAGRLPMQCIQVDSPNHSYLCGTAMIPTHNSDLGIGAALTKHEQSLILRRYSVDADSLAERAMMIAGSRDGFNGSPPVTLRRPGRMLVFGGMRDLEDRQRYKGDPKDLMVWDEIPDFLEQQYTFVIGWNRSANPNQRSRVICTGNPPTTPEGLWVTKRWAAWLDPSHPKFGKVKEGELLWYTTIDGNDTEVNGPGPHWINGEPIIAKSRTFIRSKLSDNPDLAATNYDAVLAAMPEELREAYREGRFDASLKDRAFQLIPTAWVRAAQERWTDKPPIGVPQCALGIDCTGGGIDPMVISARHDGWFAPAVVIPGHEIPNEMAGRAAAGHVVAHRRDNSIMIVDMGGGYGGPLYEHLHMNFDTVPDREPIVKPFKGSEGSVRRTQDGTIGFNNRRTEALWKFREALDPGQAGGSPIMLYPSNELLADLTAPTYELRRGVYHAEGKEDVCKRLGRSTNEGDAVVMCWTAGPIASTDGAIWDQMRKEMGKSGRLGGRRPNVVSGRQNSRK